MVRDDDWQCRDCKHWNRRASVICRKCCHVPTYKRRTRAEVRERQAEARVAWLTRDLRDDADGDGEQH
jgi:hypothetical protein